MTHINFVPNDEFVKPACIEAVRLAKKHQLKVLFTANGVVLSVWPNSSELEVWEDYCKARGFTDYVDLGELRLYLNSDKFKSEGPLMGYVSVQDVLNRMGGTSA